MARSSTRIYVVLARLCEGPATNAQIADLLETHSGDVSRMMAQLREKGRVRRIDGGTGRGTIAVYALPEPRP